MKCRHEWEDIFTIGGYAIQKYWCRNCGTIKYDRDNEWVYKHPLNYTSIKNNIKSVKTNTKYSVNYLDNGIITLVESK